MPFMVLYLVTESDVGTSNVVEGYACRRVLILAPGRWGWDGKGGAQPIFRP